MAMLTCGSTRSSSKPSRAIGKKVCVLCNSQLATLAYFRAADYGCEPSSHAYSCSRVQNKRCCCGSRDQRMLAFDTRPPFSICCPVIIRSTSRLQIKQVLTPPLLRYSTTPSLNAEPPNSNPFRVPFVPSLLLSKPSPTSTETDSRLGLDGAPWRSSGTPGAQRMAGARWWWWTTPSSTGT